MPQYDEMEVVKKIVRRAVGIAIPAILGLVIFFGGFYTVETGTRAVVTRFGAVTTVADPGFHFKAPMIDSVTTIDTRARAIEWSHYRNADDKSGTTDSRMESYSKDQQPAHISVKVVFHAKGDENSIRNVFTQYRDVDGYEHAIIVPRAYEAVKTVFGTLNAVNVVQDRAHFNQRVEETLRQLVGTDFVVIEGVQIQDIKFSDAYEHAVEARMQAEVEVAKVTQNLERTKKEAEIQVVQAEAAAKSTKLRGEAEAAAIRARSDALRDSPKLVELTAAEKWDGHLPQTMIPGSAVPFISMTHPQKQ